MTLTLNNIDNTGRPVIMPPLKAYDVTLDFSSTYNTGGEIFKPGAWLGLNGVKRFHCDPQLGYLFEYDYTNDKVKIKTPSTRGLSTEVWPDVKGAVFASITSDAASAALNDATVLALTDATVTTSGGLADGVTAFATAGKTTGLTNPNTLDAEVVGRSVVVVQNQNGAGGTWTAGFARVVGTAPDGSAQTEDVALQTSAIADTKFRLTVGTKAFATVTRVLLINSAKTAAQAGPASSRLSVGIGTIFGLRGLISAEADIKSVQKGTAAIAAATYVATASPSQIDMGADVADDVDITVEYQGIVDGAELPSGTSLTAITGVKARVAG